jgi:hypothetical protein
LNHEISGSLRNAFEVVAKVMICPMEEKAYCTTKRQIKSTVLILQLPRSHAIKPFAFTRAAPFNLFVNSTRAVELFVQNGKGVCSPS